MNTIIKYTTSIITILFCLIILLSSIACFPQPDDVILTSSDGIKWTSVSIGKEKVIKSIVWSDKLQKFVAVGYSGIILASTDGSKWTSVESENNQNLFSITWAEKIQKFVAVGNNGIILSSYDGNKWTSVESETIKNLAVYDDISKKLILPDFLSVVWSDKLQKFVAVGGFIGGHFNIIITSSDGSKWTIVKSKTLENLHLYDIVWSDKLQKFVAVGDIILTSADGTTWTSIWTSKDSGVSERIFSIAWSDKLQKFAAVGYFGTIKISSDGTNWTSVNSEIEPLFSIIWSDKLQKFVAVGGKGRKIGL